ncbi:MAG: tetratricopeptide repeat protein [Nitrospirae bacterium]|nr:tetratricopeptide repeat protein [Nitrospirota bacterium]
MKIIKKRVPKKKDIAETEEIQSAMFGLVSRAGRTFQKYRLVSLISLILLLALTIGAAAYYYLCQKWDKEAAALQTTAHNYYLEGNYKEALSKYQEIVKDYSTARGAATKYQEIVKDYSAAKGAATAMYYIGNSHLALGEPDQAIMAYQEIIGKHSDQETILPLVYLNLGSAYLGKKDYSNAITAFNQASTLKDSPVADRGVYEIARVHEISGDKAAAIERYQYLIKTFPNSPWKQDASARLNKIQGGAEGSATGQLQDKTDTKGPEVKGPETRGTDTKGTK